MFSVALVVAEPEFVAVEGRDGFSLLLGSLVAEHNSWLPGAMTRRTESQIADQFRRMLGL